MAASKITIKAHQCQCERCGHCWRTKTDKLPKFCPKCKTIYWNRPRRKAKEAAR